MKPETNHWFREFKFDDVPLTDEPYATELAELIENLRKSPRAWKSHNGQQREFWQVEANTIAGYAAEVFLRMNSSMVRATVENVETYCKKHPYYYKLRLPKYIKYHDLIIPQTGEIVEVKAFARGCTDPYSNDYLGKLIQESREKVWRFNDHILIFERHNGVYTFEHHITV